MLFYGLGRVCCKQSVGGNRKFKPMAFHRLSRDSFSLGKVESFLPLPEAVK